LFESFFFAVLPVQKTPQKRKSYKNVDNRKFEVWIEESEEEEEEIELSANNKNKNASTTISAPENRTDTSVLKSPAVLASSSSSTMKINSTITNNNVATSSSSSSSSRLLGKNISSTAKFSPDKENDPKSANKNGMTFFEIMNAKKREREEEKAMLSSATTSVVAAVSKNSTTSTSELDKAEFDSDEPATKKQRTLEERIKDNSMEISENYFM